MRPAGLDGLRARRPAFSVPLPLIVVVKTRDLFSTHDLEA